MELIQAFDEACVFFIYNHIQGGPFDGIMAFITKLGDKGMLWIALTLLLLILSIRNSSLRPMAISCALALILSAIFCNIVIKPAVMRIRPYDILDITLMVERLSDYSFPSGHTSAAFAFATALWLNNRRLGISALTAAFLMALTRLYLCVHFPTDVIAGAMLGCICAVIAVYLVKKFIQKNKTA